MEGVEAPYPSARPPSTCWAAPDRVRTVAVRAGTPGQREARDGFLIDMALLSTAFALISYLVVLRTVFGQGGLSTQTLLSGIYPVSDVLLAAYACALVLRSASPAHVGPCPAGDGYGLYALSDTRSAVFEATGRDYDDGVMSLGYSRRRPSWPGARAHGRQQQRAALGLPRTRAWSAPPPDAGVFIAVIVCTSVRLHGWVDWALVGTVLACRLATVRPGGRRRATQGGSGASGRTDDEPAGAGGPPPEPVGLFGRGVMGSARTG